MGCTVLRGAREMTAATDVGTRVAEFDDDFVGKFLREPARVRHSLVGHLSVHVAKVRPSAGLVVTKYTSTEEGTC